MKATELMLGDWVSALGKNCRITSIDKYDAKVCTDPEDELFFLDDIYPIPLTPEILEKNGFVFRADNDTMYGEYYLHNQSTFAIKMFNGYLVGMCMSEDLEFHYVHELQHALRLCGLGDLADNFKV